MNRTVKPLIAAGIAAAALALSGLPAAAVTNPDPHGAPATCCSATPAPSPAATPAPAATVAPAPAATTAPTIVQSGGYTGAVLAATATAPGPALANTGTALDEVLLGLLLLVAGALLLVARRGSRLAWSNASETAR